MRRHKFNARKTTVEGITFDSLKEASRYQELKILERASKISNLRLQPKYELLPSFIDNEDNKIRGITWKADFEYIEDGQLITEDVKGVWTEVFKLKRKLFLSQYRDNILRIT